MLIALAVPIAWMVLAQLGPTGAAARDITRDVVTRDVVVGRTFRSGGAPTADAPSVQLIPTPPASELVLSRNPFAYAPRDLPPAPDPPPISIVPPPAAPPAEPPVALSLIGVASATRADGRTERTAIIAGPIDALYFVRESDAVTPRYRVNDILTDSVLLVDTETGSPLRLTLR